MWYAIGAGITLVSILIGLYLGLRLRKNRIVGGTNPLPPAELIDEIKKRLEDDNDRDVTIDKLKERLGI